MRDRGLWLRTWATMALVAVLAGCMVRPSTSPTAAPGAGTDRHVACLAAIRGRAEQLLPRGERLTRSSRHPRVRLRGACSHLGGGVPRERPDVLAGLAGLAVLLDGSGEPGLRR